MTDICCIGHITRDRIITQDPPMTTHCAGGSAYYMAWAFQALPHDVDFHMITSVSRELMPEVNRLCEAGIKVTAYESPTNVFFENKYGANMDHRTQRVLAKSAPFTLRQLECEEARVFHLGTLLADDFTPKTVDPQADEESFKLAITRLWNKTKVHVDWSRPVDYVKAHPRY